MASLVAEVTDGMAAIAVTDDPSERWIGVAVPGLGLPRFVLQARPLHVGEELHMTIESLPPAAATMGSCPSSLAAVEAGLAEASAALHELQVAIWGPMVVKSTTNSANKAWTIASFFVPGGFLLVSAAGAGVGTLAGVSTALSKGKEGTALRVCTTKLNATLHETNGASLNAARAAGAAFYARASLVEQPVSSSGGASSQAPLDRTR